MPCPVGEVGVTLWSARHLIEPGIEAFLPGRDIIVIGASAGGVQALLELVRGLPADMPAAVFVVVHTSPASPGVLPQILQRHPFRQSHHFHLIHHLK